MNDDELRAMFGELRDEERRGVPTFSLSPRAGRGLGVRGLALAMLLLITIALGILGTLKARRSTTTTSFTTAEARAARAITDWRAPTDALLRPPGSDVLTELPSIPSKGVLQP